MCEETAMYVKARCRKYHCQENRDCTHDSDCILTDVICGSIYLNNSCYNVLWQSIDIDAAITVNIENKSDYIIKLIVKGKRHTAVKILPHQQTIVTVQNVHKLIVKRNCNLPNNNNCKICYNIGIHYISDLRSSRKHIGYRESACNDNIWLPISSICSAFM
ncbi:hypothetical protein AN1V17_40510 [Vallitalea sediminicola]